MATSTKIIYQTEHGAAPSTISIPNVEDLVKPDWLRFISYANNRFLGNSIIWKPIYESTDGINWTERNPANEENFSGDQIYKIEYGNNMYMALSSEIDSNNCSVIYYSTNLQTWNYYSMPQGVRWISLKYQNGLFIMYSMGTDLAVSSNGFNWSFYPLSYYASSPIINVNYVNNVMLLSLAYGGLVINPDGLNWYTISDVPIMLQNSNIYYHNNTYFASTGTSIIASTNLYNWTEYPLPSTSTYYASFGYNGKIFSAVTADGATAVYSTDGKNWHFGTTPADCKADYYANSPNIFLAVSSLSTKYLRSEDGINYYSTYNSTNPITVSSAYLPSLTADGYLFKGWSLNNKLVKEGDQLNANSTNTFVAIWEKLPSKVYCGNSSNIATPISKIYCGDNNGFARKIIKVYAGDENNIARLCWKN